MRPLHDQFLDAVSAERGRIATRRGLLTGAAKMAAGGALALTAARVPAIGGGTALAQMEPTALQQFDLDVLNYALTLEHLEFAFYRDGIGQFQFGLGPFDIDLDAYLQDIRDHEEAHVQALTQTISDLGGEPVEEADYDFGYTDGQSFLDVAQALENTGVSAYDGAAAALTSPDLLTTAGTIVAVEARHAAYLNLINGDIPFPAAFETPLPPSEVLDIASQFIVSGTGS